QGWLHTFHRTRYLKRDGAENMHLASKFAIQYDILNRLDEASSDCHSHLLQVNAFGEPKAP
ncbi:MAG: hypothetical protein KDE20_25650, partial [Caldilineaceae bacterium]|nr:hypothetical protein [Caldilineaceae bacterium]